MARSEPSSRTTPRFIEVKETHPSIDAFTTRASLHSATRARTMRPGIAVRPPDVATYGASAQVGTGNPSTFRRVVGAVPPSSGEPATVAPPLSTDHSAPTSGLPEVSLTLTERNEPYEKLAEGPTDTEGMPLPSTTARELSRTSYATPVLFM